MLEFDEKRNYTRMDVNCDITYKFAGSSETFRGQCTSISGAGVSFVTNQDITAGKAMEITIVPNHNTVPPMTAFIEVVRSNKITDNSYKISATIKSIKGS